MKKIIAVLIVLIAFLIFVFYTTSGLRLALAITSEFIPGKLNVKEVSGSLAKQISISNLSYKKGNIRITAHNINLLWQPFYLLQSKLIIKKLHANDIVIGKGETMFSPIKINNLDVILSTTGYQIDFADVNLQGPNILFKVKGQLKDQYNYNWLLHVKELNDFIPQINGALNAQGQITGKKDAPELNLAFEIKQLQNKIDVHGNLQARLDKHGLFAKTILRLPDQPSVTAQVNIDKNQKLQGKVFWHTTQLQLLELFSPQIKNVQGKLDVKFKLAGTLDKPKLQGKATLQKGSVYIPAANVTLQNINLIAQGNLSEVDYSGHIYAGDGYLRINGKTDLDTTGLPTEINVIGKDFLLSDIDTIKIKVTPTLKLLINKQRLDINGSIIIPWAKIQSHDFSTTETLPSDVIFVEETQQKAEPAIFAIYTDIKIILGDHIDINAMGFKGRLAGQVEIKQQPKLTPTATGELVIHDGSYDLYGQQLTLEKSKVVFAGPMDNPGLDIRAVREFKTVGTIEDLIVGTHITGTFDYPKTVLYSDPSGLSQEDILSYLMFGQSSSQLSQDKAGLLIRAASALHFGGPSRLTMLTDNVRGKFGLSEFGLATEATGPEVDEMTTNTAFVMGKYILPYVYVSYSVGLLDAVNIFRVRYKLGKKWAIQSESSSLSNGIDLLYSIVRD